MPLIVANNPHLPILRDRTAPTAEFRAASHALAPALLAKLDEIFRERTVDSSSVILVIVLRSSIAMLDAALHTFPSAPVAVAGLKRDEKTAIAHWYYENFPPITNKHTIVIIDPMLATGGSAEEAVLNLKERGADLEKIFFVGIIAAPEGVARLTTYIPEQNIILAAVDEGLDAKKFIVPGLGDFGDRYFGYSDANVNVSPEAPPRGNNHDDQMHEEPVYACRLDREEFDAH